MAKPSGSNCNLNCTYCFYLSKEALPGGPGAGKMDDAIPDVFIRPFYEDHLDQYRGRARHPGSRECCRNERCSTRSRLWYCEHRTASLHPDLV